MHIQAATLRQIMHDVMCVAIVASVRVHTGIETTPCHLPGGADGELAAHTHACRYAVVCAKECAGVCVVCKMCVLVWSVCLCVCVLVFMHRLLC